MRTEAEFMQLVEAKLAAAPPKRRRIGPKTLAAALSAAALAALALGRSGDTQSRAGRSEAGRYWGQLAGNRGDGAGLSP